MPPNLLSHRDPVDLLVSVNDHPPPSFSKPTRLSLFLSSRNRWRFTSLSLAFTSHSLLPSPMAPARGSGLHFSSGPPPPQLNPNLSRSTSNSSQDRLVLGDGPAHLARNKTERVRIGGLAQVMKERAQGGFKQKDVKAADLHPRDTLRSKLAKWMVNEGEQQSSSGNMELELEMSRRRGGERRADTFFSPLPSCLASRWSKGHLRRLDAPPCPRRWSWSSPVRHERQLHHSSSHLRTHLQFVARVSVSRRPRPR